MPTTNSVGYITEGVQDSTQDDQRTCEINVSGQKFATTLQLLSRYPDTKLGKLHKEEKVNGNNQYYFDGDPEVFKEILKFYGFDELHCPKNVCTYDFQNQLEFWGIDIQYISECCSREIKERQQIEKQFGYFERRLPCKWEDVSMLTRLLNWTWLFLTDPGSPNQKCKILSKIWTVFYLLVTFVNGVCYSIETLPSMWVAIEGNSTLPTNATKESGAVAGTCEDYVEWKQIKGLRALSNIDASLTIFFALEIWIRFICCSNKRKFWKTVHGLDMVVSNIECITYAYFLFVNHHLIPQSHQFPGHHGYCSAASYMEIVALVFGQARLLRLLSYASIYSGLKVLLITLYRSWKEILLLLVLLTIAVMIFGPLMFYMSSTSNSENNITSIPLAYWFVMVTMTTVGYGDTYPVTVAGYAMAIVVMISGLMITALPIAIVGGNFATVYEFNQNRDKQERRTMMKRNSTGSTKTSSGKSHETA